MNQYNGIMNSSVSNKNVWFRVSAVVLALAVVFLLQFLRQPKPIPVARIEAANVVSASQPKPTRIKIDKINVEAPVIDLGLNNDGTLAVPKTDTDVGWYTGSPAPGGVGPAIMVGHLDSFRGAAVFIHLNDLESGDEFSITRDDGSVAVFRVDSKETYSQDNFPTEKVYGALSYPGIRLITCSGKYLAFAGHYSDNLVIFGTLVDLKATDK